MILAHGDASGSPLTPHLHPDVTAVVVALALAYWVAVTRLGPRRLPPGEAACTRRQATLMVSAVITLWVFSEWPVHDLSEGYLYSVHMVQHSVYTLVLPPLFILGTPPWLWRWLLRPVVGAFRQLVRPAVAIALFSAVTVATHLPALVTAAVRSGPAHLAQHVLLVAVATVVWWPLASPLPELPRLSARPPRLTAPIRQMVYLFSVSLVPSVVRSTLIWARATPYRVYETFPRLWGIDALSDQQWAGAIMELFEGGVLFGLILVVLFGVVRRLDRPAPPTAPGSVATAEA